MRQFGHLTACVCDVTLDARLLGKPWIIEEVHALLTSSGKAPLVRESIWIFLVSMTLMLFEVNLIRLFSILTFYHLAFFVLAIALFGIGLGGLYAQILRERSIGSAHSPHNLGILPILLAVSVLAATWILLALPLREMGAEGTIGKLHWIFVAFLAAATPFFLGSMFISTIFAARPEGANKLYFSDLLGASTGCLLAVASLQWLGGLNTPFLIAGLALLPSLIPHREGPKWLRVIAAGALLVVAVLAVGQSKWSLLDIRRQGPVHKVLFSKWNYFSRIEIEEFPGWRGWRPSKNYTGPVPEHLRLTQDGRAPAFIVPFDGDFSKVEYLRYDITAIPFYIANAQRVLVIGAGGGRDILAAKLFGVPHVTGIELNPTTVAAMRGPFRKFSGNVYGLPGVEVVCDNGRTFANRDTGSYDLIFSSLADTQLANTQGAYILSENYLYTVEAYESYWDRLAPSGACCTVSSTLWGDQMTRLVGTAAQAMQNKGVENPSAHMMVVMTAPVSTSVMKGLCMVFTKNPLTSDMIDRTRNTCKLLGYDLVWPREGPPHDWTEGVAQLMDPKRRGAFLAAQPLDLSPLHDDRPYFFHATKPRAFLKALIGRGDPNQAANMRLNAFHLLVDLFFVAFTCVVVLMLSPLLLFRRQEFRQQARALQLGFLLICFLLGIAYMLVEIAVLQRLFVLLGDPTLTFAVTLCAMLAFTGFGSLLAGRVSSGRLWTFMVTLSILSCCAQLAIWAILPGILAATQGAPLVVRFLAVTAILAVLATPMGMLFPSVLRLVGDSGLNMTCWVWGMNGVGSVLGSVSATLISMNLGIQVTFLAGTSLYAAVAVAAVCLRAVRVQRPLTE